MKKPKELCGPQERRVHIDSDKSCVNDTEVASLLLHRVICSSHISSKSSTFSGKSPRKSKEKKLKITQL